MSNLGFKALSHAETPKNKPAQERYEELMHDMCMKFEVESPTQLSVSKGAEFHQELSSRWNAVKKQYA